VWAWLALPLLMALALSRNISPYLVMLGGLIAVLALSLMNSTGL